MLIICRYCEKRGSSKCLFFKWSDMTENYRNWEPTEFQRETTKLQNRCVATFAAPVK